MDLFFKNFNLFIKYNNLINLKETNFFNNHQKLIFYLCK